MTRMASTSTSSKSVKAGRHFECSVVRPRDWRPSPGMSVTPSGGRAVGWVALALRPPYSPATRGGGLFRHVDYVPLRHAGHFLQRRQALRDLAPAVLPQ